MGGCCSAPDGDIAPVRQAQEPEDPEREHELWIGKVEGLRRLIATTAAHVEPGGGQAIVARVDGWAAAMRARAAAGEYAELMGSFEPLVVDVGTATRTMAVLKSLSQAMVLQAVTFIFMRAGLLALTNCMLADVAGTWRVEIDLRERGRVRLSHVKTQGKAAQVASLDFRVTLQLEEEEEDGHLQLSGAHLELLAMRPNLDAAIAPPERARALLRWQEQVNAALAPSAPPPPTGELAPTLDVGSQRGGESEEARLLRKAAGEWRRDVLAAWSGLEPHRGTTAFDIYRMCVHRLHLVHNLLAVVPPSSAPSYLE